MKLTLSLALLAAISAPVRAADKPVRLKGAKAEDALRRFVTTDPRLKAKLDDAARREEAFLAENRDSDLHDAVSDINPADAIRRQLAHAPESDRERVLEQLPGMKAPVPSACVTLADCQAPELALDVPSAEQLPDAVRSLVRPWMLVQQARGSEAVLSPASGDGDALLTVTLKGVKAEPLTLNVSPRLLGGFKVWFDQPLALSSLYGRERDAALKTR